MGSWREKWTYAQSEDSQGDNRKWFSEEKPRKNLRWENDNQEKINAIHNFVRQNIAWDGTSRKSLDGSLKKALENKKGSSAEINLLLGSLLEKAGLTVFPVLISTRDHGFVRESIPVTSQFNYMVCLVESEGKQILLDATDKLLPPEVLPERCLKEMICGF